MYFVFPELGIDCLKYYRVPFVYFLPTAENNQPLEETTYFCSHSFTKQSQIHMIGICSLLVYTFNVCKFITRLKGAHKRIRFESFT